MARPRLLVLTSVHHADDNRIREKTIRSLQTNFDVTYAARPPSPASADGLLFVPLNGGRFRRVAAATRLALSGGFDVVSLHDPELVPTGVVTRLLRRRPVVFDMHEDVPAQIRTKSRLPRVMRRPLAFVAGGVLRVAERFLVFTLAEPDYSRRLRKVHPVLLNEPRMVGLPEVVETREVRAVYVGDITPQRGAFEAIRACGNAGLPLTMIGDTHQRDSFLTDAAEQAGTDLTLTGRLPHRQAMELAGACSVALSPLHDIPNYQESIPTKVLEYLALGVPVVASDLPATRRLVDGLNAVLLVAPEEVDALAVALRRSIESDGIREAILQAPEVRSRFGWNDAAVAQIYEEAMSGERHVAVTR